GESSLALAGGVNMILSPETSIFLSKARALAPDGTCKTFDTAADGYARGEGCGVVVLKRLSDALADGDRVLALIRGSAVNHDGHSNGLTAPNGPSQESVIRAALAHADVSPAEVGYVEAHGTGTSLGDPIEVRALAAVLGEARPPDRPFALGSIKTNVGHLEAAAGIAGVLKVVQSLRRGQIPPHLHLDNPSPFIPWSELPLTVPTTLSPWPDGYQRRIAGVSSFGFSGTNAHVVLEEAPSFSSAPPPAGDGPYLLPISARSPEALRALAAAYADFLGPLGSSAPLGDICYTASVRRSHHEYRLAVTGRSREELAERLRQETGDRRQETGESGLVQELAERYLRGESVEWSALYPSGGRCVPLPSYPWQRERFWATDHQPTTGHALTNGRVPAALPAAAVRVAGGHPLLQGHVQPALQPGLHLWETTLDLAAAPYLRDHQLDGQAILPAASYCEVGLAAGAALPGQSARVESVSIQKPLTLTEGQERRVQVVLSAGEAGQAAFQVFSRGEAEAGWTLHAEGAVTVGAMAA
ncbi:MAG: polyketide synthase dehydratase domain-containing protein, partial [Solirubrobacterales bacterium]|nr:polyketide synthase dehydratase domain-containing protein [Solirubrobacterales bacterium]